VPKYFLYFCKIYLICFYKSLLFISSINNLFSLSKRLFLDFLMKKHQTVSQNTFRGSGTASYRFSNQKLLLRVIHARPSEALSARLSDFHSQQLYLKDFQIRATPRVTSYEFKYNRRRRRKVIDKRPTSPPQITAFQLQPSYRQRSFKFSKTKSKPKAKYLNLKRNENGNEALRIIW